MSPHFQQTPDPLSTRRHAVDARPARVLVPLLALVIWGIGETAGQAQPPAGAPETAAKAQQLLQQIETLQQEIVERRQTVATKERQAEILRVWDELLQAAGQPPMPPQPQPQQDQPPQPSPEQQPDEQPQPGQQQPTPGEERPDEKDAQEQEGRPEEGRPQENDPNQQADRSTEQARERNQRAAVELMIEERQRLMRDVWGSLPPQVREKLLNASDEKYLPQYEERIREYFRALAEEKTRR